MRLAAVIIVFVTLSVPGVLQSADRGASMTSVGSVAHEEVIEGVKATFKVLDMKESMRLHGTEMPKGIKETHHLAVQFTDAETGKLLIQGEARVKVQGPDRSEQTRDLARMMGHFGVDLDLSKKGSYGMMVKFKVADNKVRTTRFWYVVK